MAEAPLPLAPYLREELAARGWTKTRFADAVPVSRPTASKWLTGRAVPEPSTCRRIAALFELRTVDVLAMAGYLAEDEQPRPETPAQRRRRRWLLRFRDLVDDLPADDDGVHGLLVDALLDVLAVQLNRLQ